MADSSLTPVSSVAISPDARLIVAACGDSLSVIAVPEVPFHDDQLAYTRLSVDGCRRVSTPSISSLCFPGQSTVYVASSSGYFSRYRLELLGEPVCEYTVSDPHGREGEVTGIASVGADSIIATSGKDGVIRCWDPETRQSIARLSGHKHEVRAVAVAESVADGERLNRIQFMYSAGTADGFTMLPYQVVGVHARTPLCSRVQAIRLCEYGTLR
jgi:WD40 repeat protein